MLVCSKRYYEEYATAKLQCERVQCSNEHIYPNEYKLTQFDSLKYQTLLIDAGKAGTPTGWFTLIGNSDSEGDILGLRKHFCSYRCLSLWAKIRWDRQQK